MGIILKITGIIGILLVAVFLLQRQSRQIPPDLEVSEMSKTEEKAAEIIIDNFPATSTAKEALQEKKEKPVSPKPSVEKENRTLVVHEKTLLPPIIPAPTPPSIPIPISPPPPVSISSQGTSTDPSIIADDKAAVPKSLPPPMPPLDEAALFAAVVKIECPTEDGRGKYIGSGFVINDDTVITAAHVVKDSGKRECRIIFSKDRRPIYYLKGTLENGEDIKKRHDEEGIDVALMTLPALAEYNDARAIFKTAYPSVRYPFCKDSRMLGDILLHFGYPSNFLNQDYLSQSKGEAVLYADIQGIEERYSSEQEINYKSPIFSYTKDQSSMHPYMISRVPTFYGDSGGLAFNKTKQCILGPHRGGTIGGGEGENYSIFPLLGWERIMIRPFAQ